MLASPNPNDNHIYIFIHENILILYKIDRRKKIGYLEINGADAQKCARRW